MLAKDAVARFSDDVIELVMSCIVVKTRFSFRPESLNHDNGMHYNKLSVALVHLC